MDSPTNNSLLEYLQVYEARLGKPWELSGDWLVCGDLHVPFTDYGFAERVALVARKHLKRPRKLLVAGDFFNLDSFSTYVQVVDQPTWAMERETARALLHFYMDTFSEIWMLMGNHERRLQRFTFGAFEETDLIAMVIANPERVKMSNFGYCTVDTAQGVYRVTHPKNYSVNRLTVADQLALKYDQHVISFHEHHIGLGWDRYGRHLIINGGCLVDPAKLAYVYLDDNKNSIMKHGFVLLKDGIPTLFGDEPITDWSRYGRSGTAAGKAEAANRIPG